MGLNKGLYLLSYYRESDDDLIYSADFLNLFTLIQKLKKENIYFLVYFCILHKYESNFFGKLTF